MQGYILIKGARQHNLKGIDLALPKGKLITITGPSGSGKSSLAIDTIYAEGQRRYIESLSAYARQFLDQMEKPDVESIEGLSPAIAIDQRITVKNPRSTVGTITEIYDYLRLLYARVGAPHCHRCGQKIVSYTVQQMVDHLMERDKGSRLHILAPIVRGGRGDLHRQLQEIQRQGFLRVRIDGKLRDLSDEEITLDRSSPHDIDILVDRLLLEESIRGRLTDSIETTLKLSKGIVLIQREDGSEQLLGEGSSCLKCGTHLPEITPQLFSFNSPYGACKACNGLGVKHWSPEDEGENPPETCPACEGRRLRPEALSVKLGPWAISELAQMNIAQLKELLSNLDLSSQQYQVARNILKEIDKRLNFLLEVGLGYLCLDRSIATLSGGESQRIRLATQIGSRLSGILYILDEPTIGLHPRDNARLLSILKGLRDLGNTLLVIEHDRDTIMSSDYIVDLGPGSGPQGGQLVALGSPREIGDQPNSLTGKYLAGKLNIPLPERRREPHQGWLIFQDIRRHNLKNITVEIPLGLLICITGVSGSGKSTLLFEVIYQGLREKREGIRGPHFCTIRGYEAIDKVINITQAPIGRSPRSNPATYTGIFTLIRDLFAQLPEARHRGYSPGRFSFNVKGGRCEACQGEGMIKVEMYFLPDIYVTCEACNGRRFNRDTLEIRYKGLSIADILEMTVAQAVEFFRNVPSIVEKLDILMAVGLDYLKLGQAANTLSGGEAQRIKLAKELARKGSGHTLYLLDEPTIGLHFAEIERLLKILNRLVDAGNTVIVIEHNLDVIKNADWIIDLGPEGGEAGGQVVATGTPEQVATVDQSYTGQYLRKILLADAALLS